MHYCAYSYIVNSSHLKFLHIGLPWNGNYEVIFSFVQLRLHVCRIHVKPFQQIPVRYILEVFTFFYFLTKLFEYLPSINLKFLMFSWVCKNFRVTEEHSWALFTRATMSKHSTLLPTATISNDFIVKFRPFDKVECCFDIVAVFCNNVERVFREILRKTGSACSTCFDFVERTKFRSTLLLKNGSNVDATFDCIE